MKDINIQYATKKEKIFLSSGAEIAYVATLPECDALPQMSAFYKKAEESCRRYCAEKLPSLLPSQTDQYRYRLSCKDVCENDRVTVTLTVTLTDRTSRQTVEKYEEAHIWKDDLIIKRRSSPILRA